MQLIHAIALLLSASAARESLAAPLDARCAYEPDHVHVTCKGNNENYPRGVDVTYDLGKRFDAEQFMRRSDALDVIARGMDEQRIDAIKRADGTLDVDATGDMDKLYVRHNGEHHSFNKPLSHFLQGFGGPAKPHARSMPLEYSSSFDSTTVNGQNVDSTHKVQLGNECYVQHNNKTASCSVRNPKRAIVEPRDTNYGDIFGGGNNVGNNCNFGSGSINTRNVGASMSCTVDRRAWIGKRDTNYGSSNGGVNEGNICNFGNGNIQARDGAQVKCTQSGHPTYGPNAGTTIVGGSKRQNNQCIHGNTGDDGNDDMSNCEQTTSPIYGPNGGHAIIIARDFDLKNVDDVNAYHNEIRAFLPNANRNWRRDQEVCDGVPVGPVGPQADYYTKRDIPAAAKTPLPVVDQAGLTYSAYVKREIPERRPLGNAPWADGGIIRPTPVIKGPIAKTSKAKRCVNTPIAPVGPSVTYHSKSELNQ